MIPPRRLVLAATVLLACTLIVVGCGGEKASSDSAGPAAVTTASVGGGEPSTTSVAPTTTAAPTTTVAPTTTAGDAMEAYKAAMKEWQDLNGPSFAAGAEAMGAIDDPLTATEDDVKAMEDFAGAIESAAKGLADIKPPAQLSSAHQEYGSTLDGMAKGLVQLGQAVKARNMTGIMEVVTAMGEFTEKGTPARTTLEEALGFTLSGAGS